jgi:hypothetical protein
VDGVSQDVSGPGMFHLANFLQPDCRTTTGHNTRIICRSIRKRCAVDREFRWIAGQRSGRSASHCMPSPMLYTEPYGSV